MPVLDAKRTELPPDILFSDILPRLPAKSLSRFTCVSKQWHSFLRSPRFLQMHILHINSNQNDEKLLFLPKTRPWVYRTIDCETPTDGFTAVSRPVPFQVGHDRYIWIITSLNGMICLGISSKKAYREYCDLILWNPLTGDHKTLPKPTRCPLEYKSAIHRYEFYYSYSENDYKLVWLISHQHVYIFSLKSDSWIRVESTDTHSSSSSNSDTVSYYYHIMLSVMLNKKFDFLRKLFDKGGDEKKVSLGKDQRRDFMGFVVLKRQVYFCVAIINSKGEYDTIELLRRESRSPSQYKYWVKVTRDLDLSVNWDGHPVMHMIRNGDRVLHWMRNGDVLMYSRNKEYVYVLDMKKPTKDIIRSINVNVTFHPARKYIETVVSPNQYMIPSNTF